MCVIYMGSWPRGRPYGVINSQGLMASGARVFCNLRGIVASGASGPPPDFQETAGGPKSAPRTHIPIQKLLFFCSGEGVALLGSLREVNS